MVTTLRRASMERPGAVIIAVYLVALAMALAAAYAARDLHPLVVAGTADLAGTLAVFAFSRALDNSSVYDPYWSVAPIPLVAYFIWLPGGAPVRAALLMLLVSVWGARLTWNWYRGWGGMAHEDWRYQQLREQTGRAYWLVSLLGIHLFPTLLVYGGAVAAWAALVAPTPLGWSDIVGAGVAAAGILLEATADNQLRQFVRSRATRAATLQSGVWRHCRHPNYLGELLFWWGLAIAGVGATGHWGYAAGAVALTGLFVFVSIPLIDRRMLARRPEYAEIRRRTPALLPRPWRRGLGATAVEH